MALSDIAHCIAPSKIAAALALQQSNPAAFKAAVLTYLQNKFPGANLTAADFTTGRATMLFDAKGRVAFGRGLRDAQAASDVTP